MPNIKFGKAVEVIIFIAAIGVLAENVVLVRQNRQLREDVAPQIVAGTQLGILSAPTLDGHIEPVSFTSTGSKLLVFTFSPGCRACQINQDGWMRLASSVEQKGVRVLWVSRDPVEITRDYSIRHGIPLSNTIADPTHRIYVELGLARVPNTVLVGRGGKVERVWAGGLDKAGWDRLFGYFGERQDVAPSAASAVGAAITGCGPELADASAKNCK